MVNTIVHIHRHSALIYDEKDELIRQLKRENHLLQQRINILLEKRSYINAPKLKDVISLFHNDIDKNQIRTYFKEIKSLTNQWAITLTLAPAKFPLLTLVPHKDQIDYFNKFLSQLKYKDLIGSVYGCYEEHENGNIHCHLITTAYCIDSFIKRVQKYLTDRVVKTNKKYYYYSSASCAVKTIPSIEDLTKWLDYIEKKPVELFTDVVYSYDNVEQLDT